MPETALTLDTIVSLAKRRGFVYPTSEIYGGLANSYEYGPMGVELLRKIKNLWWETFISRRPDMVGLDSQILQHPQTWVASGHVGSFADPMVEDLVTHKRYRVDHLIEAWVAKEQKKQSNAFSDVVVEDMTLPEMAEFLKEQKILSPDGNPLSEAKGFSLLFETEIGVVSGEKSKVYLRGETAQGIFTNFKQILDSTRVQLPFGVGQIGKSFRNEITTGQFVFRTLEFEQAEIEYFFNPATNDWQKMLEDWKRQMERFVVDVLGVAKDDVRWRQHTDKERSFYSTDTYDLDFKFPFGWKELWGVAYRSDYDLKQHSKFSGESLEYTDPFTQQKFTPHVIEPALGINRAFLAVLCSAYHYDEEKKRVVLKLKPSLAPYQVAVFPLVKNKPELVAKSKELFESLLTSRAAIFDDRGNIGKRYLSQDEIGTPACVTVDYQTLEDNTVTVRNRDTAAQERVEISALEQYLDAMIR